MGMIQELISTVAVLITKPFSLFGMACSFGFSTFFLVAQTWMDVVKATIQFHVNLFKTVVSWGMTLLTLPIRLLNAIQRERQLEIRLSDLQFELENLFWAKKQLEGRLKTAINERRMVDQMLNELEDEHDKAIDKIEELEKELHGLKVEKKRNTREEEQGENICIPYGIPAWKTDGSGIRLHDLLKHVDALDAKKLQLTTSTPKFSEAEHKTCNDIPTEKLLTKTRLMERRSEALQRSLFSAVLSILVGIIIWEAEDPCMPLVVALFTVVGMSLLSVVQFFSTIENKPASDAVALLSFNWFILGTLTYPTLPIVARLLSPLAANVMHMVSTWLISRY